MPIAIGIELRMSVNKSIILFEGRRNQWRLLGRTSRQKMSLGFLSFLDKTTFDAA
jgi:hypothetical protein